MVSDPRTPWVWRFRIAADGSLTDGREFCHLETSGEADRGGMAFNVDGLLFVATEIGVQVCDRRGRVTALIEFPGGGSVGNVFFGGPGLRWLYVTDGDKLYRRPVRRAGTSLNRDRRPPRNLVMKGERPAAPVP